jgi:hypothetical protein
MSRKRQLALLAFGLVFAGATAAKADVCVTLGGGGGTIVGEGFTLLVPPDPKEVSTCKPFSGFEDGGLAGGVTGTGCITYSGGQFTLHYMYHNNFPMRANIKSYFETGFCRFKITRLPAPGLCRGTVLTTPGGNAADFLVDAQIETCDRNVPDAVGPN